MEQFVAIAVAHFVALLIPGVDFFLIARTAMTGGWRGATGVCSGIAAANGIFIVAAFSGVSLISHPVLLATIQLAGGGFLVFAGVAFLRSKTRIDLGHDLNTEPTTWLRNCGLGIASGLLNPKNALFYVSLAAAVSAAAPLERVLYGVWMFTVVLAWDVVVAVALGSKRALARMGRVLPWLTKLAGGVLVVFGGGMIVGLAVRYLLQA
ncbi:lysine transporter LysE [Prauserella marina]|uniref:Threonine/homoserine/homoserine lactone efflux protein n=1 Tax=Prauserella marina TaxID=530584 RepID=A0A222VQ43_9PSEU|nr:LysE family transporter [Prauserella marina]ASR35841.1 lysine transporter LysE [Prauserella marina]PWV84246.1 threonine/homoserine/homoserine lactone efflux protein [Prauserella marina]SDC27126.1 Threonine/homoserine/homoserine lactone efflux protein [Prauserella marina]